MSGKKKHRKPNAKAFRDYLADRMSGEERNAFEKELQKDPFAGEAIEGLSSLSEEEVHADLEELRARLHHAGSGRDHRIVLYRIAAAVAGIILITSAYFIFEKKISDLKTDHMARIEKNEKMTGSQVDKTPQEQESEDQAFVAEDSSPDKEKTPPGEKQAVQEKTTVQKNQEEALEITQNNDERFESVEEEPTIPTITQSVVSPEKIKEPATVPGIALSESSQVTKKAAPQTQLPERIVSPDKRKVKPGSVSGTILSAEDASPVVGASVTVKGTNKGTVTGLDGKYNLDLPSPDTNVTLVASMIGMKSREVETGPDSNLNIDLVPDVTSLDEVVVIGYGNERRNETTGAVSVIEPDEEGKIYTEPTPVGGFDGFKEYVDKNQVWPPEHPGMNRAIVVLKFSVAPDNRPTDIQVLRSPGDDFSKEAVRLLKNGPDWSRAMMRDSVIDTTVKIRIVFKR